MLEQTLVILSIAIMALVFSSHAVAEVPLPDTSPEAWKEATDLAAMIRAAKPEPFARTRHPDAQWFPNAGLGLFMHWGIHSVEGVQPSWAMIKDYPYGGELHPPERYYAQAERFDPQHFEPDTWMAAAKKAGFTYAVLTTKHHDGYALWPTAYGDMSTRQYLGGRDLLQPYVDACRKHGIKVGFYFSPRDWHYPGFPVSFDHNLRDKMPPVEDIAENQKAFDDFFAYTVGQLHELLTRYGQIDVLWFDGMGWQGINEIFTEQTLAWIRSLQPGIIINDRWGGKGDFSTPEWNLPEGRPEGWWENCISWNGHWGYNPGKPFKDTSWVLERLVRARSWGGNFLLNVGPAPDGTMPPEFYKRCDELAAWMDVNGDALEGAYPSPGDDRANVPITTHGHMWYLLVPPSHEGHLEVRNVREPASVTLMRAGSALPVSYKDGTASIEWPVSEQGKAWEAVAITWPENRWEKTIRSFEEKDKKNPPKTGGILFVGSSSIVGWNLEKSFPGLGALNRGFGGSQYWDAACYVDRVVIPYRPETIVLYDGDNDIASGKSPEWVFADFEYLIRGIQHALPDARIIIMPIKPSVARWGMWDDMRRANQLIEAYAGTDERLTYVDGATPILGEDGKPDPGYFREDGLHFNEEGYAIWNALVRPLLESE